MKRSQVVEVLNVTRGTIVGRHVQVANTCLSRLFGLLGKTALHPGSGLLIKPSSGVHTFGMVFPIDVIGIDHHLRVLGVWEELKPFRFAALSFKTRGVLELPVGAIGRSRTLTNDQLVIRAVEI